ncbi:MAG: hypothetical protein H0V17_21055 [Deltaproteobacteria bacterium]|nr:hypothetical protein [Deltaproteobacteria bacterium]
MLRSLFISSLVIGCAGKPELDPSALDAIDVNEAGKDDSFRRPTVKGPIGMNDAVTGRVTRTRSFHAYDFTAGAQSELVRLDVRSAVGEDLFLLAYRRSGNFWVLADYNDDCGDGSLNACLALPTTAGSYRLVVTTYDALVGAPIAADYELAVSCKDGGCLAQACGGLAGLACADGQFCNYAPEEICGAADGMGTCTPTPEFCTEQFDPVCGCDDQTYGNACEANAAGVSVISQGACEVACGARAGDTCSADQYCKFELNAICGHADGQGACAPRPEICTQQFEPVCGCDSQTYSNECMAGAAGVGVLHLGACVPEPE